MSTLSRFSTFRGSVCAQTPDRVQPMTAPMSRSARLAAVTLLFVLAACAQPEGESRPNLLFVVTDDQRFDLLGIETPMLVTPNLDRLASEGMRFERAYVTTPICAASRASLLTGMVERTHGYTFGTPPLARVFTDASYPRLLRAAGYHSGFIGKLGVTFDPGAVDSLFDVFVPLSPAPYMKPQPDGTERHLTDITADLALAYLDSVAAAGPFALTVSFNAPHADDGDPRQYIWPPAMDSLYRDAEIPVPALSDEVFRSTLPPFLRDSTLNRVRWHWRFDEPGKARAMTKGYFRMISGVDAAIGRIRAKLEERGVADRTIIVFTSDNGYFLGERGYAGKWLPYDLSIHVPLIVYDPRSPGRGATNPLPVLNIDLAPTLIDLAGVAPAPSMQGRSLVPLLRGESPPDWRSDFFVEHLFEHPEIPKHEGVRGARWWYARYFERNPVYEELYDTAVDPLETTNLAGRPEVAAVLDSLRRRTDTLRDGFGGVYRRK